MSQNVLRRLATEIRSLQSAVNYVALLRGLNPLPIYVRHLSNGVKDNENKQSFDTSLLEFLVCPLSKKPLRYEEKTNELINEELGIAYPVLDGIPNMIPQDARLIQKKSDGSEEPN